jgi:hypothetical protein
MRALSAVEMLQAWELGLTQYPPLRPLALVAAALERSVEEAATLSIGERDACLLALREWTFGSDLAGLLRCERCGGMIEVSLRTHDLRLEADRGSEGAARLAVAGFEVEYRAPNSFDLLAIQNLAPGAARERLLRRCLLDVRRDGIAVDVDQLPPQALASVVEKMAAADPQADLQLAIDCPHCNHSTETSFDVGAFCWAEIHAWARRLLREVHVLAAAYSWREADILAMTAWRRQFYLGCIGA